jgi:GT2 family glycosyltransferase
MAERFRVIALVSAYNEGDIISAVLGHLIENEIDVYLLDDRSTDDTVEQARPWLGRGLLDIETLPERRTESGGAGFDWSAILRRKEALARELEADWFIHHDADEIRESPWPSVTLRRAIQWVDTLGFNAIDFHVINFRPVDDGYHRGLDPRIYFAYYEEGAAFDAVQLKCWKGRSEPVSLAHGGHEVRFADRRVFPIRFLLRHYPIRGQTHGKRKVFEERRARFLDEERRKGWHLQYDCIADERHSFLGQVEELEVFDANRLRLDLMLEPGARRSAELERSLEAATVERERSRAALEEKTAAHDILQAALEGERGEARARAAELEPLRANAAELARELETEREASRKSRQELDEHARARKDAQKEQEAALATFGAELAAKREELDAQRAELAALHVERDGLAAKLAEETAERELLEKVVLRCVDGMVNGNHPEAPHAAENGAHPPYGPDATEDGATYRAWLASHEPSASASTRQRLAEFGTAHLPTITVVLPIYRPNLAHLARSIASVREQTYPRWQLSICDDGSADAGVRRLFEELRGDCRLRISIHESNRGISAALNTALGVAAGDLVCFLDQDDEIHPDALAEIALAVAREQDVDLLYTDEDKLDENGEHCEPFFKPDWSPDTLLSQMYVGHLLAARRSLVELVGGFRPPFDGSQDYDLVLRLSEQARRICHLPRVLYHWRKLEGSTSQRYTAKPWAHRAARAALQSALVRRGEQAEVVDGVVEGTFRVKRRIRRNALVSVIIPFRDGAELLQRCLDTLVREGGYENWEAILVDNQSWEPETSGFLCTLDDRRMRVEPYPHTFNYSALNNWAARQAKGELLLFLNSDIERGSAGWLAAMVEHAERPEVGAVGARLLYPEGCVQHGGVVVGIHGLAGHAFRFCPEAAAGYYGHAKIIRNWSAVTGACMMVRRGVFEEVGGFDEALRVAFNDIDFCLRVRERGYRIVYTPFAELLHNESMSRGVASDRQEIVTMLRRWGERLATDPYFNPNFSQRREDFVLSPTPEESPWKALQSTLTN